MHVTRQLIHNYLKLYIIIIYYTGLVTGVEVASDSELQEGVAYELTSDSFGATLI